ncbi:hypothetical protein [Flavobacterium sp.]|uniref:hypothetical protein n=1 Tax=Flavobacterium sp. TaxID=239 RepID=UPI00374DB8C3
MKNFNIAENKIDILAFQIKERIGKSVSVNVTQAIIESFGIRQVDVLSDYGIPTIEELAQVVHQNLEKRNHENVLTDDNPVPKVKKITNVKNFLKDYITGIIHVFPIFFQVLSVVIFGYSLWVYADFNILQSTSVVVGVMSSLILTGGVVTVVSKQISFYWNHKNEEMVFQTTVYLLKKGFQVLFLGNLFLIIFSVILGLFAIEMAFLSSIYSMLIGGILLFIAPLHVIKRRGIITVSIIVGTVVSLILKYYTSLSIYITHWLGISLVTLILFLYLLLYFIKRKIVFNKFSHKDVHSEFIVYNNYIYFFYGTLFYFYIFLDRILAWSVQEKERFLYFIFFEKDYEIGMDIALLTYLLVAGIMEFSISSFTTVLDDMQSQIKATETQNYGRLFLKKYFRNVLLLTLSCCLAFSIQAFLMYSPHGYNSFFDEDLNDLNIKVCILGSLGYFFLSWAALNVLYFFTLGQPLKAFNGLLIAILCNVSVGLFLSRLMSYELSVIGFLFGSFVFMLYTTYHLRGFFKKMDYYYYAAF